MNFTYNLVFQPFFTTSPKFFCQEGDVSTIKILLKNTKSMYVYWFFLWHLLKSVWVYEYKLETEQCNISVPENKSISRESSWYLWSLNQARIPPKSVHVPTLGMHPRGWKTRTYNLNVWSSICVKHHAKYLPHRLFHLKVIVLTNIHNLTSAIFGH